MMYIPGHIKIILHGNVYMLLTTTTAAGAAAAAALVIICTQGIYNYILETNHVSRVYSVTAVLFLQFVLHVILFPP